MNQEKPPIVGLGPAYTVLDQVANVLVGTDPSQAELLWAVLTALRGPDFELNTASVKIKWATTAVIRNSLARRCTFRVPDVAVEELSNNCGVTIFSDNEDLAKVRREMTGNVGSGQSHFIHHARQAFLALGLKWDEVNP